MRKFITVQFAQNGLLALLTLLIAFHFLILFRVIPFEIVWGGRLKDVSQMIQFESTSILINLLMLAVIAIKTGLLKINITPLFIKTALWTMFFVFFMNTMGNLVSNNFFEKIVFTPLTLLLAVLSLRIAISK